MSSKLLTELLEKLVIETKVQPDLKDDLQAELRGWQGRMEEAIDAVEDEVRVLHRLRRAIPDTLEGYEEAQEAMKKVAEFLLGSGPDGINTQQTGDKPVQEDTDLAEYLNEETMLKQGWAPMIGGHWKGTGAWRKKNAIRVSGRLSYRDITCFRCKNMSETCYGIGLKKCGKCVAQGVRCDPADPTTKRQRRSKTLSSSKGSSLTMRQGLRPRRPSGVVESEDDESTSSEEAVEPGKVDSAHRSGRTEATADPSTTEAAPGTFRAPASSYVLPPTIYPANTSTKNSLETILNSFRAPLAYQELLGSQTGARLTFTPPVTDPKPSNDKAVSSGHVRLGKRPAEDPLEAPSPIRRVLPITGQEVVARLQGTNMHLIGVHASMVAGAKAIEEEITANKALIARFIELSS